MQKSIICLTMTALISGCAFKEAKINLNSTEPPQVLSQPTRQGEVTAQWVEENKSLSPLYVRSVSTTKPSAPLLTHQPLVVSRGVPNEIEFSVSSPSLLGHVVSRAQASGRLSEQAGIPSPLSIAEISEDSQTSDKVTRWKVKVSGFDHLLSSLEESKAYISLQLFQDGTPEPLEEVQMVVMTPPSKLHVQQFTSSDYETKFGSISPKFKNYVLPSQELGLLQVLEITNKSEFKQSVTVPFKLHGVINTGLNKRQAVQNGCHFTLAESHSDDTLTEDLFYLPLSDVASNLLKGAISENQFVVALEAGESVKVGIYGAGLRVKALLEKGYQQQDYSSTDVVDSCHSVCAVQNEGFWVYQSKAKNHWQALGLPGDSGSCVETTSGLDRVGQDSSCRWVHGPNQPNPEACNRCALWEISNGVAWNDFDRRFCIGTRGEGWQVEKHYQSVMTGTRTSPVYLRLAPESTTFISTYSFDGIDELSPARNLVHFVASETVQAQ